VTTDPEGSPRDPRQPADGDWANLPAALLGVVLVLVLSFLPVANAPVGLEHTTLADGHPHAAVFEVTDPTPAAVAAATAWLEGFPALGTPQTGSGPEWTGPAGEARILLRPEAPVPQQTLDAIATQVRERPEVRWTLAPSDRTFATHWALRPLVALACLALVALAARREQAIPVTGALLGASTVAALWFPLHPTALAFVPVAVAAGWVATTSRFPWLALAALTLLPTGHPTLQAIGALLALPAAIGCAIGWWRPAESPAPSEGRAASGRLAVAGSAALLIAGMLAAPAPPADLLETLPQTATVEPVAPAALAALEAHGLGTIETGLGERWAIPLVGPWVAEAFLDTLAAEAPDATLSLPERAAVDTPWLAVGAWGVAFVVFGLLGVGKPDQAVARLLPAFAVVPAMAWAALGVGPEQAALAVCLAPVLAILVVQRTGPAVAVVLAVVPPLALHAVGLHSLSFGWVAATVLGALLRDVAPLVAAAQWPAPWVRRWGSRLAWVAILLVHLDVLVLLLVSFHPPPSGEPPDAAIARDGRASVLGPHRLHREHGVFVLATRGAPYESGFAAATLADPLRQRLEVELFDAYTANVPWAWARWLISRGSAVAGSGLDAQLLDEHRIELRGDIDAAPERYAFAGPSYTRKVYYHAIHDIGQALVDTPLLGCTGFVAGPQTTPDGHWRIGRAFDFDGGVAFDRDKVIRFHQPDDGMPYLSVAFAGIVGAVSGVNEAGIGVVINASGSADPPRPGTPMTLIVREILQHARTLDEAAAVLEARTGFVSENVLVVDADANRAALFEVSPARVARLEVPADRGWLAFSNHFRTEAFADDPVNEDRIRELTTVPRLQRAEELVARHAGSIDMGTGAAILSDRMGPGDQPLPRGHRHALNADIATHGVVIDATDRSLWVSVYPNLSGGWVSLSLADAKAGRIAPVREVDADPDAWRAVEIRTARELLRASRRSRAGRAAVLAERALQIWPDHPEPLLEAGVLRVEAGVPGGEALLDRAEAAPLEYRHQARAIDAVQEGP
jgi:hypothetical protein